MYAQVEKGKKGKVRVNANAFMPNKLSNTEAKKLHSGTKGKQKLIKIRNHTTAVTQRARPDKDTEMVEVADKEALGVAQSLSSELATAGKPIWGEASPMKHSNLLAFLAGTLQTIKDGKLTVQRGIPIVYDLLTGIESLFKSKPVQEIARWFGVAGDLMTAYQSINILREGRAKTQAQCFECLETIFYFCRGMINIIMGMIWGYASATKELTNEEGGTVEVLVIKTPFGDINLEDLNTILTVLIFIEQFVRTLCGVWWALKGERRDYARQQGENEGDMTRYILRDKTAQDIEEEQEEWEEMQEM